MLVDVTSMMASVDSSTFGSGTVSTRTSRLPCQVTAFIATPFGRCGKRTRQQATGELRLSTHAAGAETVSGRVSVDSAAKSFDSGGLLFGYSRFPGTARGTSHAQYLQRSRELAAGVTRRRLCADLARRVLSIVRPIRPSGRATLHCIIW